MTHSKLLVATILAFSAFLLIPTANASLIVKPYTQTSVPASSQSTVVGVSDTGTLQAQLTEAREQLVKDERVLGFKNDALKALNDQHVKDVLFYGSLNLDGKLLKSELTYFENERIKKYADYYAQKPILENDVTDQIAKVSATRVLISQLSDALNATTTVKTAVCPSNSTLNGSTCVCATNYTAKGNSCVPAKELCTSEYGQSAYFSVDSQSCYACDSASEVFDGNRCVSTVPVVVAVQPVEKPVVVATSTVKYATALYRVNVRATGSVTGKKLGTVNAKYRFAVVDDKGEWVKVKFNGKDAWVLKSLVTVK